MDARRAAAIVRGDILIARQGDGSWSCAIDTPAWFAWLEGADAFAFAGPEGTFTARKERPGGGRGGGYWRAYRKRGGRLRRAYLGRSASVTLARLRAAAATLATSSDDGGSSMVAPGAAPGRWRPGVRGAPAFLTSFVGRERERAEVAALLATTRLLTVTGPGGVGKTRLALAVAAGLADADADGVAWVELAPLADRALVPQAVAAAVGAREAPGRSTVAALLAALRRRRLLLVMDNCEHLVPVCAGLIVTLLAACPGLRVLATSRQALGVAGETIWPAPPLGLPPRAADRPLAEIAAAEAVRLFRERATAAEPRFAVTERNAPAVVEVCWRLDGVPLALELAAARARVLTVEQIAARLDDAFNLLRGGSSPLPRHRALRATLDWSHALLTEAERVVLRRLAVFAGGWTLEAAEAVCAGDEVQDADVLDLLTGLVDKSLAQAETTEAGAARYRLLEPVRQYAAERLAGAGEPVAARRRHAAWCLALAERAKPELDGGDQLVWLARLEAERDNLRAALAWGLAEAPELGLRLAAALCRFWFMRDDINEGRRWLDALLARAPAPSAARMLALRGAGRLARLHGDAAAARAQLEASLALSRRLGDRQATTGALANLGFLLRDLGEYTAARALFEECLVASQEAGDRGGEGRNVLRLGMVDERLGEYRRARALLERGLPLVRAAGDRFQVAAALHALGVVGSGQGEFERAEALLDESLIVAHEVAVPQLVAASLYDLGNLARRRGDLAQARRRHEAGLALARAHAARLGMVWHLVGLGRVAQLQGDAARALTLLDEGVALARATGLRPDVARALHGLGLAAEWQGEAARATEVLRESLALRREMGERLGVAECLEGLAAVAAGTDQPGRAARLLGAAEALRRAIGAPRPPVEQPGHEAMVAAARAALGELDFELAWAAGAASTLEEAVDEALGDPDARPPTESVAVAGLPANADGLTKREAEVLRLIAAGRSNRAIGAELALSVRTVERHITNLYGKIDAANRADATAYAFRHGQA